MLDDLKELSSLCHGLKLLYVEDDALVRETTLKLLNNFFQDVTTAVDGKDGLEKFQNNRFDLVLSDINMPNINGLEMLAFIRKENQNIPVLLFSAYNDTQHFTQALSLDIEAYILKPLVYEQFLHALYKVVQKIDLLSYTKDYKDNLEKEVNKRNEEIADKLNFDYLTGLLSRYSFFRDIEKVEIPIILLIDIDKFKVVNEVYGSTIGSKVLEKFSLSLSNTVQDEEYRIYRLSSDEFAILDAVNYIDTDKYEELIEKLFEELNNLRLKVDDNIITVDITIGLSTVQHNGYESAKIALDYAKKHRKPYVMYSSAIDYRKESSLTLQRRDEIASAIDDNRIIAVYQPIVDIDANIVKYETLMRLQDEESLELISPFYFLDVAIKTRLYEQLSERIIFKALEHLKNTNDSLSINFTYSDIKNRLLMKNLETFFKTNQDIGKRTIFEITESEAIENYDIVKSFIVKCREYDIRIAIDDFGSGFSNFEYILEIEPDYLKIDGSLIKDINTDVKAYTLVEAIVQFSHKLGIKVIAEYVHCGLVFDMLKELGVDEYQGFYFSKPLKEEELIGLTSLDRVLNT